jgi:hypothetical protein
MNAVHNSLTKHGVYFTPEVIDKDYGTYKTSKGAEMRVATLTIRYTFYGPKGDSVQVVAIGEASDTADKASNKAMSAALKYALLHTFCVPTKEDVDNDADRTTPERATRQQAEPRSKAQQAAKSAIDGLEADDQKRVRDYFKERNLPKLTELSDEQAGDVLTFVSLLQEPEA